MNNEVLTHLGHKISVDCSVLLEAGLGAIAVTPLEDNAIPEFELGDLRPDLRDLACCVRA